MVYNVCAAIVTCSGKHLPACYNTKSMSLLICSVPRGASTLWHNNHFKFLQNLCKGITIMG